MDVPVAVFDLDKTLVVRDCVVPFMRRVAGAAGIASTLVRRGGSIVPMAARRDRDGLKALFVRELFADRSVDDVMEMGLEFADMVVSRWIRHDVAERLRWHQDQDHVVLLVTASLAPYAEPMGELLELDGVLCTRLAAIDGVLTGELDGPNCRGSEKVVRIERWCSESGLSIESVQFAYGDSPGDGPMLDMAPRGEWIGKRDIEREALP